MPTNPNVKLRMKPIEHLLLLVVVGRLLFFLSPDYLHKEAKKLPKAPKLLNKAPITPTTFI